MITPAQTETIARRWHDDEIVVVAATGPSLTPEVARLVRDRPVVAVSDAWRMIPSAAVLYSCDAPWWRHHDGARAFAGERWSSHGGNAQNDKAAVAEAYSVRLVAGRPGDTFSRDPAVIHFGNNSGFQALNVAILMGARRIVLVGYDMRVVDRRRHFFGDHPKGLINSVDYRLFAPHFAAAARALEPDVAIINATPGSALTCWPMMPLAEALEMEIAA
jgi:hypothetical protein